MFTTVAIHAARNSYFGWALKVVSARFYTGNVKLATAVLLFESGYSAFGVMNWCVFTAACATTGVVLPVNNAVANANNLMKVFLFVAMKFKCTSAPQSGMKQDVTTGDAIIGKSL